MASSTAAEHRAGRTRFDPAQPPFVVRTVEQGEERVVGVELFGPQLLGCHAHEQRDAGQHVPAADYLDVAFSKCVPEESAAEVIGRVSSGPEVSGRAEAFTSTQTRGTLGVLRHENS